MNMDNNFKIIDKKWDMEYQTSFTMRFYINLSRTPVTLVMG